MADLRPFTSYAAKTAKICFGQLTGRTCVSAGIRSGHKLHTPLGVCSFGRSPALYSTTYVIKVAERSSVRIRLAGSAYKFLLSQLLAKFPKFSNPSFFAYTILTSPRNFICNQLSHALHFIEKESKELHLKAAQIKLEGEHYMTDFEVQTIEAMLLEVTETDSADSVPVASYDELERLNGSFAMPVRTGWPTNTEPCIFTCGGCLG